MKYLALLLVLSCSVQAEGVICIGDSITTPADSWCEQLGQHHKVLAQNGRTIAGYDLPRDIKAGRPYTTAVYYLGTNDMILRSNLITWYPFFVAHIDLLESRGFRVVVLIPPEYPDITSNLRTTMWLTCQHKGYECHLAPYDFYMTEDGYHPTPSLHQDIAYFVQDILSKAP